MRVLSWNVQGAVPPQGSKERIRNQTEFIDSEAGLPEILMLNEVTTVQRDLWRDLLGELGYHHIVDTLDWAQELRESNVPPHQDIGHSNGNLTAVHEDFEALNLRRVNATITEGRWDSSELKHWSTNFPEKILTAELELPDAIVELWNIRTVPGSMYGEEKIKILENVYNRITESDQKPRVLAGDLNSPKTELADGTAIPWGSDRDSSLRGRWMNAELNILKGLDEVGMVDVFRDLNGYDDTETEEMSFQSKRFDHLFASRELNPVNCYYNHDGLECSDHAPLVADFDL